MTLPEAKALLKEDDDLTIAVYDYWLNKRLRLVSLAQWLAHDWLTGSISIGSVSHRLTGLIGSGSLAQSGLARWFARDRRTGSINVCLLAQSMSAQWLARDWLTGSIKFNLAIKKMLAVVRILNIKLCIILLAAFIFFQDVLKTGRSKLCFLAVEFVCDSSCCLRRRRRRHRCVVSAATRAHPDGEDGEEGRLHHQQPVRRLPKTHREDADEEGQSVDSGAWCMVHARCLLGAWCMPGACMVRARCVHNACLVHVRCVFDALDAYSVHARCVLGAWCMLDACSMHVWCIFGAFLVHVRCVFDACSMHTLCVLDAVRAWSVPGACSIRERMSDACRVRVQCVFDACSMQAG